MALYKNKYNILIAKPNVLGLLLVISILFITQSCEKWNETGDTSHISQLPTFEITGGDFISYIVVDSGEYADPGAKAFEGDKELAVYSYGEVDLTKVGVYIIYYYAENSDGLSAIGERTIAVTHYDVSDNDLFGTYTGTRWSPQTEMEVKKINDKGLYKCSEVFGYPYSEMKGRFVDLGEDELILLPGEGDFGRYAMSEGNYTLSTLSWTISLLDEPYEGNNITVTWTKVKEE